jgi:hypothetical protein
MDIFNQKLMHTILQEIDSRLNQGILPVHNDHLNHLCEEGEGGVLEYLLYLKAKGLISGNLVSRGADQTPHRVVNIRLTYVGMKALKSQPH